MKLDLIHLDLHSIEIPYTCSNCQSSIIYVLVQYTDLYRLKERSTSTEVMGANFIFPMFKGVSSTCNNTPFIPQCISLINFRQFKPRFLFNL
jgi:hypothetical protein